MTHKNSLLRAVALCALGTLVIPSASYALISALPSDTNCDGFVAYFCAKQCTADANALAALMRCMKVAPGNCSWEQITVNQTGEALNDCEKAAGAFVGGGIPVR